MTKIRNVEGPVVSKSSVVHQAASELGLGYRMHLNLELRGSKYAFLSGNMAD